MAELQLTLDDVNELFRVMPDAARMAQLIAQRRVIGELEVELDGLRSNGHKEASNAKGRKEELSLHAEGDAKSKGRS